MNKILYFLSLCLFVMGAIGGIGCTLYCNSIPCALGVVILIIFALPKVKDIFDKLNE